MFVAEISGLTPPRRKKVCKKGVSCSKMSKGTQKTTECMCGALGVRGLWSPCERGACGALGVRACGALGVRVLLSPVGEGLEESWG